MTWGSKIYDPTTGEHVDRDEFVLREQLRALERKGLERQELLDRRPVTRGIFSELVEQVAELERRVVELERLARK